MCRPRVVSSLLLPVGVWLAVFVVVSWPVALALSLGRACQSSLVCPPGQFNQYDTCTDCASGKYSLGGPATTCTFCPGGMWSDSAASSCLPCPAGSVCLNFNAWQVQRMQQCAPGTFSTGGATFCIACPAPLVSLGGATECMESCPPGTYALDGRACTECPAGRFTNVSSILTECKACPPGTYTAKYSGAISCAPCKPGLVSAAGAAKCQTTCDQSFVVSSVNSSFCIPCRETSKPISLLTLVGGSYVTTCVSVCPSNSTLVNDGRAGSTLFCSPYPPVRLGVDQLCLVNGACNGAVSTSPLECYAGLYPNSATGRCDECPLATWSYYGADSCSSTCPAGRYADSVSSQCIECGSGVYSTEGTVGQCMTCPAGTIPNSPKGRNQPGATKCTPCSDGQMSAAGDSTCENTCSDIGYPLTFNNDGGSMCISCPNGRFVSITAPLTYNSEGTAIMHQRTGECIACPVGMVCWLGQVWNVCPDTLVAQDGACIPPPAGTYAPDLQAAMQCPIGTFSSGYPGIFQTARGIPSSYPITIAQCRPCTTGVASSVGSSQCSSCGSGKYAQLAIAPSAYGADVGVSCVTSCGPGTYLIDSTQAMLTSSPSSVGTWSWCQPCPGGTYLTGGACAPCPPNTVSPSYSESCMSECPLGYYRVNSTSPVCLGCSAGTYMDATARAASVSTCAVCAAGSTPDSLFAATACQQCTPGTFSTGALIWKESLTCDQLCPRGTSSNAVGATNLTSCIPCPIGTFNEGGPDTQCKPCPVGSVAPSVSSVTCIYCAVGKYYLAGATTASATCVACPAGFVAPQTGSLVCTPCDSTQVVSADGAYCIGKTILERDAAENAINFLAVPIAAGGVLLLTAVYGMKASRSGLLDSFSSHFWRNTFFFFGLVVSVYNLVGDYIFYFNAVTGSVSFCENFSGSVDTFTLVTLVVLILGSILFVKTWFVSARRNWHHDYLSSQKADARHGFYWCDLPAFFLQDAPNFVLQVMFTTTEVGFNTSVLVSLSGTILGLIKATIGLYFMWTTTDDDSDPDVIGMPKYIGEKYQRFIACCCCNSKKVAPRTPQGMKMEIIQSRW